MPEDVNETTELTDEEYQAQIDELLGSGRQGIVKLTPEDVAGIENEEEQGKEQGEESQDQEQEQGQEEGQEKGQEQEGEKQDDEAQNEPDMLDAEYMDKMVKVKENGVERVVSIKEALQGYVRYGHWTRKNEEANKLMKELQEIKDVRDYLIENEDERQLFLERVRQRVSDGQTQQQDGGLQHIELPNDIDSFDPASKRIIKQLTEHTNALTDRLNQVSGGVQQIQQDKHTQVQNAEEKQELGVAIEEARQLLSTEFGKELDRKKYINKLGQYFESQGLTPDVLIANRKTPQYVLMLAKEAYSDELGSKILEKAQSTLKQRKGKGPAPIRTKGARQPQTTKQTWPEDTKDPTKKKEFFSKRPSG